MVFLNLLGLSFETAQIFIDVVGTILLGTGIAYFVSMLFGKGAAAVSMIYLSVLFFPSWGTHYMSPFNFATALAFWVWGIIIHRKKYKYFIKQTFKFYCESYQNIDESRIASPTSEFQCTNLIIVRVECYVQDACTF